MNISSDNLNQVEVSIGKTDSSTAKDILDMFSIREHSVWFDNGITPTIYKDDDRIKPEEQSLTLEQVIELYPQWFKPYYLYAKINLKYQRH